MERPPSKKLDKKKQSTKSHKRNQPSAGREAMGFKNAKPPWSPWVYEAHEVATENLATKVLDETCGLGGAEGSGCF